MKTLLLTAVLLGLVAALRAQDPLSLLSEAQSFTGTWYTKAVVSDKSLPKGRQLTEVFPVTVTALKGGNFEGKTTIMYYGRCHEIKIQIQKTSEPGKYIDLEGKKVIHLEPLPTKAHAIFHCEGQHEGERFRIAKLMGRNTEENPEALEEFKKYVQRKGFQQEDIYMPKQKETCISGRS